MRGIPRWSGRSGNCLPGAVTLVSTIEDVEALAPAGGEIAYVTQTTLSVDDTREIVAALVRRFPAIHAPPVEDICYATSNRQEAVKAAARGVEAVIVVGAANSSNSLRLREVAEREGCAAQLVADAGAIDWRRARRRAFGRRHRRGFSPRGAGRARRRSARRALCDRARDAAERRANPRSFRCRGRCERRSDAEGRLLRDAPISADGAPARGAGSASGRIVDNEALGVATFLSLSERFSSSMNSAGSTGAAILADASAPDAPAILFARPALAGPLAACESPMMRRLIIAALVAAALVAAGAAAGPLSSAPTRSRCR